METLTRPSTASNEHGPLTTRRAAWALDPSSATFEVKIKHRLGPIRVASSCRVEGVLQRGAAGDIGIRFTIDAAGVHGPDERNDPRSRSHRLPNVGAGTIARFESTRVTDEGAGLLHVTGQLVLGTKCVPLELAVRLTKVGDALEVRAATAADHRRLGLTWIPVGPLKAPTELVMRARLIPITDDEARGSTAMARRRRPTAVNNRYSFMARRTAAFSASS
jgi:polyisoprenoid-binding protein YceI